MSQTISFTLNLDDYLTHQLYAASTSKRIRLSRRLAWLILPGITLLSQVVFLVLGEAMPVLGIFGVAWFLAYPWYSRRLYRRHYTKHLQEHHAPRFGVSMETGLEGDAIWMKDPSSEGRMNLSEVRELVELRKLYLVRMQSGVSLIIPKGEAEAESRGAFIQAIAQAVSLPVVDRTGWEWR